MFDLLLLSCFLLDVVLILLPFGLPPPLLQAVNIRAELIVVTNKRFFIIKVPFKY